MGAKILAMPGVKLQPWDAEPTAQPAEATKCPATIQEPHASRVRAADARAARMESFETEQSWLHAAAHKMVYSWPEAFLVELEDVRRTLSDLPNDNRKNWRQHKERFCGEEIELVERAWVIYDEVFAEIDAMARAGRERVADQIEREFPDDPKAEHLGDALRKDNPFEWLDGIEGEHD